MVLLESFWTPCLYYDTLEKAVKPIAFYTGVSTVDQTNVAGYKLIGFKKLEYAHV